jgi:hypothetical protein
MPNIPKRPFQKTQGNKQNYNTYTIIQKESSMQWQSIETAPKTDEIIVLYCKKESQIFYECQFSRVSNEWQYWKGTHWVSLTLSPTHWLEITKPQD